MRDNGFSMRSLVFIKQVPEVAEIRFDQARMRIIREGVPNVINAYDRRALTEAIRLRSEQGGEVVAATMGPPQARDALVEALAMGADRAVHLLDPAFAGADTLATARVLAAAARRLRFDLILCGRYSVDAETGQIGPEVAELLDLPQVTGVCRLTVDGTQFEAVRETDEGFETLAGRLPALLTAAERLNRPIKVDDAQREAAAAGPLEVWSARDLGLPEEQIGAAGSPTWVEKIQTMSMERNAQHLSGPAGEVASALIAGLRRLGVFDIRLRARSGVGTSPARVAGPAVWAVAEAAADELRTVSLELLGGAARVAAAVGGHAAAVLIGRERMQHAPALARYGADHILVLDAPGLEEYLAEPYAAALADAIQCKSPWAVLFPATANGRDFAPRIAARLGIGLTGDAIGLQVDGRGRLVQLKPAFGGNVVAQVLSHTPPQMATVRPGMLEPLPRTPGRQPLVERLAVTAGASRLKVRDVARDEAAASHALDNPEAIVTVGAGIGGPENLPLAYDLAEALGAAVGCTRKVADLGWLPRQLQIGLTGRSVKPRLYVGLGVRGAFNHLIGMARSELVIAINRDPEAEIFKAADYAVVGDVHELVPLLIRDLQKDGLKVGQGAPAQAADSTLFS